MAAYAIKLFEVARELTPTPTNEKITPKIARHFSKEVRTAIVGRSITTLVGLLELFKRFDKSGAKIPNGQKIPVSKMVTITGEHKLQTRQRVVSTQKMNSNEEMTALKGERGRKVGGRKTGIDSRKQGTLGR